jgi:hypothetical protein
MKKLPVGIQSFKKIIEGNYVYADKTNFIYDLVTSASYYFLSRPRRFGKSLLLDTIGEVFKGSKELFKGLWIYDSGYDFKAHPVIRFDMSNIANETPKILNDSLLFELRSQIKREELDIPVSNPADMFKNLIIDLHKKYNQKTVVLIDEYDKPILDRLTNIEIAETNRDVLRGLYGVLKSMDPYLRFVFVTGVTKFTKTSIFSGLNNLSDITLAAKYANICGIETHELDKYFGDRMAAISANENFAHLKNLRDEILGWYDGYSWDGKGRVINPFSLLCFFEMERFAAFWYASGTPKFLIDILKKNPGVYVSLEKSKITELSLDTADFGRLDPVSLMVQSGYLTVREVDYSMGMPVYRLTVPNNEVREAFSLHILSGFTENYESGADMARLEIKEALREGDLQKMLDLLRGLFASIPYQLHVDAEAYYHSIFYAVMTVLGFRVDAEISVSKGRIDAVLELGDKVYIMEFKYVKCLPDIGPAEKQAAIKKALEDGLSQIKSRGYPDKCLGSGKTICLAAFAFSGRDEIEMCFEI